MTLRLVPTEEAAEDRLAALARLAQRTRDLMEAVTLTDVPRDELDAVATQLADLTGRLRRMRRTLPWPEVGPEGEIRNLGNAVTGICNPYAPPLVIEPAPGGGVRAEVRFGPVHAGPPGAVHGGVSAMVLDHLLGQAAALAGVGGMTGTLTLRYREPVPYGEPLVATATVTRREGRKSWVDGRIARPDGTSLVEATGLFVTPTSWPVS